MSVHLSVSKISQNHGQISIKVCGKVDHGLMKDFVCDLACANFSFCSAMEMMNIKNIDTHLCSS